MLVLCLEWSRNPELSDDDDDMLSQARGTRAATVGLLSIGPDLPDDPEDTLDFFAGDDSWLSPRTNLFLAARPPPTFEAPVPDLPGD